MHHRKLCVLSRFGLVAIRLPLVLDLDWAAVLGSTPAQGAAAPTLKPTQVQGRLAAARPPVMTSAPAAVLIDRPDLKRKLQLTQLQLATGAATREVMLRRTRDERL